MHRQKVLLLQEIAALHDQRDALIIASYQRLNANAMAMLRHAVAEVGGIFAVVKRRIFLKFAQQLALDLSASDLRGHLALVFAAAEMTPAAQVLCRFAAQHPGTIAVISAYLDRRLYTAAEVEEISRLPRLEVLRAQLLATCVAPLSASLAAMESLLTGVIHCLGSKIAAENSSSSTEI